MGCVNETTVATIVGFWLSFNCLKNYLDESESSQNVYMPENTDKVYC